jgi:hypothetical protein
MCHSTLGYEADAPFNENFGGYFLGAVINWSSTFDSRSHDYFDTGIGDSGYKVWTIGVATTTFLRAGVLYHTHINTTNGAAVVDHGGLQGQVTRRFPAECYLKVCTTAWDTHNFISPWLYDVPNQNYLSFDG